MKKNTTKIAITTTIRSDLNTIKNFINYHINIGIDYIFIFFDNPLDNHFNYFQFYHENVQCILCNEKHWQQLNCNANSNIECRQVNNANWALEAAKKKQIDWISHIDIDELIYTKNNIKDVLLSLEKSTDVLWLPPLEAIPETVDCTEPFINLHSFKRLPNEEDQFYDGKNKEAYFQGEYFRGHTAGKSIIRISDKIADISLHKPIAKKTYDLKVQMLALSYLLHYDCYDYSSWFTKWLLRTNGIATAGGRDNRKKQHTAFQKVYNKNDRNKLIELYKTLYFIPKKIREDLKKDNMLVNIYIDKTLFYSPLKSS